MRLRPIVLLVDDDVDTREMYAWCLQARGFEVVCAGTAAAGTELAENSHPDVIVTDFTLPGEDGFALATRLRSSAALADTPAILVSGRAFVGNSGARALELFDRVLLKPVLPALKLVAVNEAVNIPFVAQYIKEEDTFVPNDSVERAVPLMLNELRRWTKTLGQMSVSK